jgi:putative membrane protein
VLPRVAGRVAFLAVLTLAVWVIDHFFLKDKLPRGRMAGHTLIGVALGLLIVFRNNSSYDRYWEGRKQWGSIVNAARNLLRGAAVFAGPARELANLVAAYALALKQHLRGNRDLSEVQALVPPEVFTQASAAANPPSFLAYHQSEWVRARLAEGKVDTVMARALESYVATFLDSQGACERILRTPIPFAYAVHIKQLLMIYLITLPLAIVPEMGWSAIVAVAAIAFGLLGIEEAGVEIEDPFGDDPNDLPIEDICKVIARDTTALAEAAKR